FDYIRFYIRLDFEIKFNLVDFDDIRIDIEFKDICNKEFCLRARKTEVSGDFEYIYEEILEFGINRKALLPDGFGRIEFSVTVTDGDKLIEKWPTDGWIAVDIPEREKEIFWQV
ncbi:MAG: hypothetical protein GY865_04485, partial [candidate division Zixibacteria bacterium]|nr:hypothetical protein [candidate division Zixibacteria bacterium]